MAYDEATETWTVSGVNVNSDKESILTITREKLGNFDFEWAMMVYETIMSKDNYCDSLPTSNSLEFTNVLLDEVSVEWTTRVQKSDCAQKISFADDGTVDMEWNHGL